jgi:hypothetical protein
MPARREPLWILGRADDLLCQIAAAIWLSIASVWRIPRAALARDSIDRLQVLVANRQALPARLNLLLASIASSLFFSWLLPERTPHLLTAELLDRLGTSLPENWLIVGAPALISLWLTVIALGYLLRKAGGAGSKDATDALMQIASAITILSCLGVIGVAYMESRLDAVKRGLPDLLILTGFWMMMGLLVVAGARYAQQIIASVHPPWQRRVLLFTAGPLAFVGTILIALVATYWLAQIQASVRKIGEGKPPRSPEALSPACYVVSQSVVCHVLLSTGSDLAIGIIRQVDIEWRDLTRRGTDTTVSLLQERSQIVQLAPHADFGEFWILRAKEPLPLAFQIATPDACQLYQQIAAFRRRVAPIRGNSLQPLKVRLKIYWQPGFGLVPRQDAGASFTTSTDEFDDRTFDTGVASLCEALLGERSHR